MQPTNYAHGHYAERIAADYLVRLNFKIVDTNWKTKWCEIDIIVQKDGVMYFTEVKYRKTTNQGAGLDYITPKKTTADAICSRALGK